MTLAIDTIRLEFKRVWGIMANAIHQINFSKGFWPDDPKTRDIPEALCLMHSEISEALEGYRHGNPPSDKIPEFSSMEEELADTVIRIMDLAEGMGYDVPGALLAKIEYNRNRPYKHGKKF